MFDLGYTQFIRAHTSSWSTKKHTIANASKRTRVTPKVPKVPTSTTNKHNQQAQQRLKQLQSLWWIPKNVKTGIGSRRVPAFYKDFPNICWHYMKYDRRVVFPDNASQ